MFTGEKKDVTHLQIFTGMSNFISSLSIQTCVYESTLNILVLPNKVISSTENGDSKSNLVIRLPQNLTEKDWDTHGFRWKPHFFSPQWSIKSFRDKPPPKQDAYCVGHASFPSMEFKMFSDKVSDMCHYLDILSIPVWRSKICGSLESRAGRMLWCHSCPYRGHWKEPKFTGIGKWHQVSVNHSKCFAFVSISKPLSCISAVVTMSCFLPPDPSCPFPTGQPTGQPVFQ